MPTRTDLTTLDRVVGNREAIGATLTDINGTAIDVTGLTITFRMVDTSDGTVKVTGGSVTLDDAANGEVSYSPAAGDVDTAGLYAMYFTDTTTSPNRLWPYDGARFLLQLRAETDG